MRFAMFGAMAGSAGRVAVRARTRSATARSCSRAPTASCAFAQVVLLVHGRARRSGAAAFGADRALVEHRGRRRAAGGGVAPTARAQGALWVARAALDLAGPFLFGSEGWKLVPGHFAERHGLIVIIALGESIVAIGAGVGGRRRRRRGGRGGARNHDRGARCGGSTSTWSRWSPSASSPRAAAGAGAERDGARLLLLPPPADGRRHRARRPRPEEDDRRRRRAAEDDPGRRAAAAARRSTCSATSPSACATCTRSTGSGSPRSSCWSP